MSPMKNIEFTVHSRDGLQQVVEAPSNVLVSRLADELATSLRFPERIIVGTRPSFRLDSLTTHERLETSKSIEENEVKNGDHLLLWASYPRETQLRLERRRLEDLADENDFFDFTVRSKEASGEPDSYTFRFRVPGVLGITQEQHPIYGEKHEVSVLLDSLFPEDVPRLRWETPIWHPNVQHTEPKCVMIRAWWLPGQGLDALLTVLVNIASYKIYHAEFTPPYPLDIEVARWVREYGEPNRIVDNSKGLLFVRSAMHRLRIAHPCSYSANR
jgi:ubiquitin-protein ligase